MDTAFNSESDSRPNLGPRLRDIRDRRKLSLRILAQRCGLSTNAISLIERGETSPSIATLHKLATALGIGITEFFDDADEQAVVYTPAGARLSTSGNGLLMESLGIGLQDQRIEPLLITVAPITAVDDDDPQPPTTPVSHPGQEFVHCLNGTVQYRVGNRTFALEPGDSLLFEAATPHCFWNDAEAPARILVVFGAQVGVARQRHLEGYGAP